ncbi:MAG: thiamine-phosphate kinase [Helicobacteraceae bacterium]|jgi:thiamine-monophosphate kinase|nr:thiamine-phosphate kinase [Helicobacteraceae bacterium]
MRGEFELIEKLTSNFEMIGDDCACVKVGGKLLLISNDDQIENTHFTRSFPPRGVGYKLVISNVSDILSCGGIAKYINISLHIPKDINEEYILEVYEGIKRACKEYAVDITGGNTSTSATLAISAFILGETDRFVTRGGAQEGDLLYISAPLGKSRFSLERLLAGEADHPLYDTHLYPKLPTHIKPLIAGFATSAIDISDGFLGDLGHIVNKSKVGFNIYNRLSIADRELLRFMDEESAVEYALNSGEEYQLIFTIAPRDKKEADRYSLLPIGEAIGGGGVFIEGEAVRAKGFAHF